MEGKPIIGHKAPGSGVYHLCGEPMSGVFRETLCGRIIPKIEFALPFDTVKDPSVCHHCALEFERRGY